MTNIGYALYQMGGLSNLVVSVFVLSLLKHLLTNEGDLMPYLRGISICIVVCMSTLKLADTVSFSEDPLTQGRGALSREGSQRPSHMLLKKQQLRNFV